MSDMKVAMMKTGDLVPYENNPRQNDEAVNAVAKSIKEFGFRQPIVVDEKNVVIVGHTRLKAAIKLKIDEVPVHVAKGLTKAQAQAYRLADNKTNEFASWDIDLLRVELSDLINQEFDVDPLGFGDDEIREILNIGGPEGLTGEDEIPEAPKEAETFRGDIYNLGRHRLLCGDSTNEQDVATLMGDNRADLLLTDPPYNVAYTGKTKDSLKIQNDQMNNSEFREFLVSAFRLCFQYMKPGASFYIWHADSEGFNFRGAVSDCKEQVRQCLIWEKNVMVMGRQDYQWQHEPCLYGWKAGASHGWYSDRKQTTLLKFDRPSRNQEHPTMKPVSLFSYQIGNSTAPQGIVYDPFSGSGTSIISCEQLGRTCLGMELDPVYCDVIVKRWEEFTGKKAERIRPRTGSPQ